VHEASIVQALLDAIDDQLRAQGARSVSAVRVRLGQASGVEADLLAWAWEALREGGPCAGTPLELLPVPVRWSCLRCEVDVPLGGPLRCPSCGGPAALVQGDEIVLDRLVLEVPDV